MDQYTIEWTNIAWQDLEEVIKYIAQDSQVHVSKFAQQVLNAADELDMFPNSGSIVTELSHSDIREKFIGKYRLIYKVDNNMVYILAFIHGARDLGILWKNENR